MLPSIDSDNRDNTQRTDLHARGEVAGPVSDTVSDSNSWATPSYSGFITSH